MADISQITATPTSLSDFVVTDAHGNQVTLSQYADKVVLIVNVASQCGFTKQYAGLQKLYEDLAPQGFTILAFPCNQFGSQEPGSEADILAFCENHYQVTFPVFAKVCVKGPQQAPLFAWLTRSAPGLLGSKTIKWNFTKFLLGRDGQPVARFAPTQTPESLRARIEDLLAP